MIELGQTVKDKVSGFVGVAVTSHEYLNGCRRISVQPPVDKDGKLPDVVTFDEPQLEASSVTPVIEGDNNDTGGPEKYSDKRPVPGER